MKKAKLSSIGLLQALGVTAYCFLVGLFIWNANNFFADRPGFMNIVFVLVLLVVSAGITGSIVFGYPAYLALKQKIKEALLVSVYTLLYSLGLLGTIIIVLALLR